VSHDMSDDVREITVFIASPDDVRSERALVEAAVTRLNGELKAFARFTAIRWENEFYRANHTFQAQISEPGTCDIVIVIFGNKLGTPLPADTRYIMEDGAPYPSGTAYELLSSLAVADVDSKPDVYVFRRRTEPTFATSARAQLETAAAEQDRLDQFFARHFMTSSGAFRRSINDFTDTDDFERKAGQLLRDWADEEFSLRPAWDVTRQGSPFRALEPFDARHSTVFFGRDRKVWRAIDELGAAARREGGLPFLLVVGASGAGKSSLVRAGVIPRLRRSGLFPPVDLCRIAVMKPGEGPSAFAALAAALFNDGGPASDPGGYGPALPELTEGTYAIPDALRALIETSPERAADPLVAALDTIGAREGASAGLSRVMRADLLLLVDQLEEIFARPEQERRDFARLLLALALNGRVWIIATLRADLYDTILDPNTKLLELKDKGGAYDLASPGPAEIEEILDRSAAAAGLVYETDPKTGERLDQVLEKEAAEKDALPLLQFSLNRLFEKREPIGPAEEGKSLLTFAAYEALGRLDGAIEDAAEKAIARIEPSVGADRLDDVLARLLRKLAQPTREGSSGPAGTAWTARPGAFPVNARGSAEFALAEALAENRLLVFDRAARRETLVRLAHDRVLASWSRAARILNDERDFFRVRLDVETQWQRWHDNSKRRDFLLRGIPLDSAQAMGRRYGSELGDDIRSYIAASRRRDQWRRGAVATAAAVFGVVALVASVAGSLAFVAEHKSERNFQAARAAADQLATSIAPKLRERKDIGADTLDIVFNLTEQLVGGIEAAAGQGNGLVERTLQGWFATIDRWAGGAPQRDDATDMARTHAKMNYEFAETYHQTAKDPAKAMDRAQDAARLLQGILDRGDRSAETRVALGLADMEIADLLRMQIDTGPKKLGQGPNPPPLDFTPARAQQEHAVALLEGAFSEAPDRVDWGAALAKALTGLGDFELRRGRSGAATELYQEARGVAVHLFRSQGDRAGDFRAQRELAWAWRKSGEMQDQKNAFAESEQTYADEVCIHRHLLAHAPQERVLSEDMPYALLKLGDAALHMGPPDLGTAADAYDESLSIRQSLAASNNAIPRYYHDFAIALSRRADLERARTNAPLAEVFALAAADVEVHIGVPTFDPESEKDPEQRRWRQEEALRMRAGGVTALIYGYRRNVIEQDMTDFKLDRLPRIAQAGENCWDKFLPRLPADEWANGGPHRAAGSSW